MTPQASKKKKRKKVTKKISPSKPPRALVVVQASPISTPFQILVTASDRPAVKAAALSYLPPNGRVLHIAPAPSWAQGHEDGAVEPFTGRAG